MRGYESIAVAGSHGKTSTTAMIMFVLKKLNINFDYVITVCDNAKERCPYFPTEAVKLHHNFPDPAKAIGSEEEIDAEFDSVRDMIDVYCKDFVNKYL